MTRQLLAVTGEVRAYFASVERATSTPMIFDPARDGMFDLDAPPSGWLDAGWVANFTRGSGSGATAIGDAQAASFAAQLAAAQTTTSASETNFSLDFRYWGKLQMAISGASQSMNLLAETAGATAAISGGTATAAVVILSGSTATELKLSSADLAQFAVGDLVACDVDYTGQTGYIGTGISGANVLSAGAIADADYIRRITYNVARVQAKTTTSLVLQQPLPGGAPDAAAKVQKMVGFADRESASFVQEWSALFVLEHGNGARTIFYYPRVQPQAPPREAVLAAGSQKSLALHAEFNALAVTDAADGEAVRCVRALIPAASAAVY